MESHGGKLVNKPSLVEGNGVRFLIMDAPTDNILPAYTELLKKKHVCVVVRACEPTYNSEYLERNSIAVVGAPFSDGEPPPQATVDTFLNVLKTTYPHIYGEPKSLSYSRIETSASESKKKTIAIHCVAGLGRAPVLAAIGLIEANMEVKQAIELVRSKRPAAFNSKQLKYLTHVYKPKSNIGTAGGCCTVM